MGRRITILESERSKVFRAVPNFFGKTFKWEVESNVTVLFEVTGDRWSRDEQRELLSKLDAFICGLLWVE